MPNKKNDEITELNQGVNYMGQGQPVVPPVQPVTTAQPPVQPMPTAQPGVPTPQPGVNNGNGSTDNFGKKVQGYANTFTEKVKSDKKLLIISVAVVAVVLLLLVVLVSNLLNPSYNVVNNYMSGMKSFNAEKIAKLYHEDIIEYAYEDEDGLIDELEESFEEFEDDDYKITGYKIRECEKYSEDELEDLAESLDTLYGIDEDDVKAARKYFVKLSTNEDGEKNIYYNSVTVIKIGNKWYLYR